MTTPERRQELYSMMLQFMRLHKLNTVPLDLSSVCRAAGADLVPLSKIIEETGLTESEVFHIWGNEDGAVNAYKGRHRIAYNDKMPFGRVRFTLSEELSHMIFGHTKDPDFNIFFQKYASGKYAQYEEEARLGAGFLVCHPRFYYTYRRILNPQHLSEICKITLPCAVTRCDVYNKYEEEITQNMAYRFSPIPGTRADLRAYERRSRLKSMRETS